MSGKAASLVEVELPPPHEQEQKKRKISGGDLEDCVIVPPRLRSIVLQECISPNTRTLAPCVTNAWYTTYTHISGRCVWMLGPLQFRCSSPPYYHVGTRPVSGAECGPCSRRWAQRDPLA